jgi:GT2 family glycosyltransferase
VAHARNRSIAESTADLIVWTDDDVLVQPDWLARMVEGMMAWEADFGFGPSRPCWDGTVPKWFEWGRHAGKFALLDYGPNAFVAQTDQTPFFTLNTAARVQAVRDVGGFRGELSERTGRLGPGEDVDLYARALAGGLKIVYLPDVEVQHVISRQRMEKTFYRERLHNTIFANFEGIRERFADVPWTFGLPRFLYRKALEDATGFLRAAAGRNESETFYRELELRRFGKLWLEARKSQRRTATSAPRASSGRSGGVL